MATDLLLLPPVSNCNNNCTLYAGFSLTNNGGQTWTAGRQLAQSMQLSWLPNTFSGRMVADYVATVYPAGGRAFPIYSQAYAPSVEPSSGKPSTLPVTVTRRMK